MFLQKPKKHKLEQTSRAVKTISWLSPDNYPLSQYVRMNLQIYDTELASLRVVANYSVTE